MRSILLAVRRLLHNLVQGGLRLERRLEPFFRRSANRIVREPLARLIQRLKNRKRIDLKLGLAEEKLFDWEEESLQAIIDEMREQMNLHFQPGAYERGGNTKTHRLVRATFSVRPDLPEHLRKGVFATERSYPADLPPDGPSFIARVCGSGFHSSGRRFGQARRARSPQIAQASGALLRAFGFRATNAA